MRLRLCKGGRRRTFRRTDFAWGGEPIASDKATTRTITGLESETTYIILAAAGKGNVTGPLAREKMTTGKKGQTEAAKVTLKPGETGPTELSFEIASSHAVQCSYMVVEATAEAPDGPTVLKEGTAVEVNQAVPVTLTGLTPQTRYTILAVATNGEELSETAMLGMATDEEEVVDEVAVYKSSTKNSVTYLVVPAGEHGYYHIAMSELMWETYLEMYGGNPADPQGSLDAAKMLLQMFAHFDKGEQEFTFTDGETWTDKEGNPHVTDVIAGLDYKLVVCETDEAGNAIPPLHLVDFETPPPATTAATLSVSAANITNTGMDVTITPSADTHCYYQMFVTTAQLEEFLGREGESGVCRSIFAFGLRLTDEDKDRHYTELIPATSYSSICVVIDAAGDRAFVRRDFRTAEPVATDLSLALEGFVSNDYDGYKSYNSVFFNVKTTDAVDIRTSVYEKSYLDMLLGSGATYETLVEQLGRVWSETEVAAANTAEGSLSVNINCRPETTYTVIAMAADVNGTKLVEHCDVTTDAEPVLPLVNSELFDKLPGNWNARLTVLEGDQDPQPVEKTFSLRIAAGVNDATAQEYRAKNRLVCLGFSGITFYDPDYLLTQPRWLDNPEKANEDYGPKWFLQIAEGDVVTVPASSAGPTLYSWGQLPCYLLPMKEGGAEAKLSGDFPVTVSDDLNTLTVHPIVDEWSWYPSAAMVYGQAVMGVIKVSSGIVLTRDQSAPATLSAARAKRFARPVRRIEEQSGAPVILAPADAASASLPKSVGGMVSWRYSPMLDRISR